MSGFINSVIINLSIIISSVLTLYFSSLSQATQKNKTKLSFITDSSRMSMPILTQLLIGLTLGSISFLLSVNRITISPHNSVDMRYVIVFFSVYYASTLTGGITALTLIFAKAIQYNFFLADSSTLDFWNNIILTILLYFVSIFLSKRKITRAKATFTFLGIYILCRTGTFLLFLAPLSKKDFFVMFIYFLLFAGIFLLTSFIINFAVSISQSVHVYRSAAIYDNLTSLYNRESFHFFLDEVAIDAQKEKFAFSLAVLDIDNFKSINDSYGHATGDAALKYFAKTATQISSLPEQRICRIGGDEFAIICFQKAPEVLLFLEKLQQQLHDHPFIQNGQRIKLKVSIGVAHFNPELTSSQVFDIEKAFETADNALYEAKTKGKNQIIAYNQVA